MSTFYPGYRWRLLAHKTTGQGVTNRRKNAYTGETVEIRHQPADLIEFDELVIDEWLHLEMMDTRTWWLRVGDLELNITIDARGQVSVVDQSGTER